MLEKDNIFECVDLFEKQATLELFGWMVVTLINFANSVPPKMLIKREDIPQLRLTVLIRARDLISTWD